MTLILEHRFVGNLSSRKAGDPILQPGPVDGGHQDSDTIARLERFCPIEFTSQPPSCGVAIGVAAAANFVAQLLGSSHRLRAVQENLAAVNQVDAAVAKPLSDGDLSNEVLDIGEVSGVAEPALGLAVRKSGRTTEFTTGEILVLDATVSINYGDDRVAQFEGQIVTSAMSQGGDSGSLLVAEDPAKAVGLLFAGSNQATIHNPIAQVLDCLEIEI